ncbi:uncharacterized protein LOC132705591 [Cylas formicarius]|uniref:uncharacterized protein LOC132705591 n=1 Tax=Cylas formicarius TaxID=197179 RepID=UPI00295891C3|nr:uncharacterized protein LOC132705591 [Cylas formicarius]
MLAPKYPEFTRTQIRSALMLADNNLDETRILLDLKMRFDFIKDNTVLQLNTTVSEKPQEACNYTKRNLTASIPDLSHTCESDRPSSSTQSYVAPLGTFPHLEGVRATVSLPDSPHPQHQSRSATVYDFDDLDIQAIPHWRSVRSSARLGKYRSLRPRVKNKVGVLILKETSGYKSSLL